MAAYFGTGISPLQRYGQSDEGGGAFGLPLRRPTAAAPAAPAPYVPPVQQTQAPTLWRSPTAPQAIEYEDVQLAPTFSSAEEVRRAGQTMRQAGAGLTGQARAQAVLAAAPKGALQRIAKNLRQFDPSAGMQQKGDIKYTTVNEAMNKKFPFGMMLNPMMEMGDSGGSGYYDLFNLRAEADSIYAQNALKNKAKQKGVFGLGFGGEGSDTIAGQAYERSQRAQAMRQAESNLRGRSAAMRESLEQQRAQLPVWQQLQSLQDQGVAYKNPQGGSEAQRDNIVRELSRWGITDLGQVGTTTDASGKTIVYNRMTGQQLPELIGSGSKGEGFTEYKWMPLPGGGAIPVSKWEESSDRGKIAQALSIGAGLLMPAVMPALTGALGGLSALGSMAPAIGAGALYGAGASALPAAITGGNMGKSLLGGALGGAIGSGVQAFNPAAQLGVSNAAAQRALNQAISGGLRGATGAAISGKPIGAEAFTGAIAGGVGGALANPSGGILSSLAADQARKAAAKQARRFFGMEGAG